MGSFGDSGRVTAAADEECRESSSHVRPAGRKIRCDPVRVGYRDGVPLSGVSPLLVRAVWKCPPVMTASSGGGPIGALTEGDGADVTVRPCFFLVLCGSLMLMMCAHCNVAQEKMLSRVAHLHVHGGGAWFRQLDAMMDSAALQVLVAEAVAQALVATATTRDNAGGSSGSRPTSTTRAWRSWYQRTGRSGSTNSAWPRTLTAPSTVLFWRSWGAWNWTRYPQRP